MQKLYITAKRQQENHCSGRIYIYINSYTCNAIISLRLSPSPFQAQGDNFPGKIAITPRPPDLRCLSLEHENVAFICLPGIIFSPVRVRRLPGLTCSTHRRTFASRIAIIPGVKNIKACRSLLQGEKEALMAISRTSAFSRSRSFGWRSCGNLERPCLLALADHDIQRLDSGRNIGCRERLSHRIEREPRWKSRTICKSNENRRINIDHSRRQRQNEPAPQKPVYGWHIHPNRSSAADWISVHMYLHAS